MSRAETTLLQPCSPEATHAPASHLASFLPAVLLSVSLLLTGCGGSGRSPGGGSEASPNVILILVDTLRAQDLGLYGYDRETSPNLARLVRDGALFEDARSQAPCTYPSANSILTGRHPVRFLGQKNGAMGIPPQIPSLAEILGAKGYATVAVTASPIVRKNPTKYNPTGGFSRGFDIFDERCLWDHAACLNGFALDYAKILRQPFFLYLHYMDPHSPLKIPEDWPRRIATTPYHGKWFVEKGLLAPIAEQLYGPKKNIPVDSRDIRHLVDLYDEEIAYFDHQLGLLLDGLNDRGLLETTLIVLVADHGEEFLEHGHIKHCHSLFDTEIKTPLLIRPPGPLSADTGASDRAPRRINAEVANLDVAPTIVDYAGIDPAELGLEAPSLRPVIEGGPPPDAIQVSSWGPLRAAKQGRFKLILNLSDGSMQLYDVVADPGETADVQKDHPDAVRSLRSIIRTWVSTAGKGSEQQIHEGTEAQERLKALGYLQ